MFIAFLLEGLAMTAWLQFRTDPGAVHPAVGSRLLRVGRDLLAVSFDVDRHVRRTPCDHELRVLYMAQGVGSVLGGPMAARLHGRKPAAGFPVFGVVITLDLLGGGAGHRGTQAAQT